MSTFGDTLNSITAHNRAEVQYETFGHLAPKKHKKYHGHILFAVGCFSEGQLNPMPIECEFKDLDSSPWFYDALLEFISNPPDGVEGELLYPGGPVKHWPEGTIWRWYGYFMNYKFVGTVRKRKLMPSTNKSRIKMEGTYGDKETS